MMAGPGLPGQHTETLQEVNQQLWGVGRQRGPHDGRAIVVGHEPFPQMRGLVIRFAISLGVLVGILERAPESARHDERRGVNDASVIEVGTVPSRA